MKAPGRAMQLFQAIGAGIPMHQAAGIGETMSPSEILAALTGGEEDRLLDVTRQRLTQDILKAFRVALVDLGGLRQVPANVLNRLTYRNARLAGIVDVAGHLRMPQTRAFGVAIPRPGDTVTDYDEARYFIVSHVTAPRETPAAGTFYPEVMEMPKADRLVTLARAHVDCAPTGKKLLNLYSLRARLPLSGAGKSAQPQGTTCALFLRAALVAAGDLRFPGNRAKLGIDSPGSGHMIYGMGLDLATASTPKDEPYLRSHANRWGKGLPTEIKPGDIYALHEMKRGIGESGHVGLVSEVWAERDEVLVKTIDGGQRNIPIEYEFGSRDWYAAAYSNSKGWYVKEREGKFVRQGAYWAKLSRSGLSSKYENRSITATVDGEQVYYTRNLEYWLSMRMVAFEAPQHDFGF